VRHSDVVLQNGLMSVGVVTDRELCEKISSSYKSDPVVLWRGDETKSEGFVTVHTIKGSDSKEILDNVLSILPNPESLNEQQFQVNKVKIEEISFFHLVLVTGD
jgi:hypothetical protein